MSAIRRFCDSARALLPLLALLAPMSAFALTPFVVKDIRVEGVQRTEAGTVFSYLPIKVGDTLDDEKAAQAVKALFATGRSPSNNSAAGREPPRSRLRVSRHLRWAKT